MKLLVLCYEYPPVGGGGGRVAASVAEGLAAKGHEVKIVTAGLRHLPRREQRNGVEILRPESFRKREDTCSVPEMALYLATAFLPALRLCREWKPDAIHAHFVVPTGALALALHWITGIPYVLTAHLGDVPGGVPEQTEKLFRFLGPSIRPVWKNASAVTAVSGFVAGLAEKNCGVRAKVILNGIPIPSEPPAIETGHPPRLLVVGRLSIQKNPLLAVRALALLKDLPWNLEIIGEGPLSQSVRAGVGENGLAGRVVFSGWLPAGQVAARLAASDILLMTSTSEGLPMAAVEALRHGLAIVGSRIGGMLDVVDHGRNGLLCELEPAAFAAALRGLLENPAALDAMRRASLEKSRNFQLADRVLDYERVLLSAANSLPRGTGGVLDSAP